MLIKDLLFNLDYFALRTEMLFLNKGRHSSWLGLALTVIVLLVTIGVLFEFSSNMIKKENPIITYTSQYNQLPKQIELPVKEFKIVIALLSKSDFEYITDSSLFKVSLNLVTKSYEGQKLKFKSNHLGVRYCQEDDLKLFMGESLYSSGNGTSYLCGATYGEEYSKEFSEDYFKALGMSEDTPYKSESYVIEGDVSARKTVYIDLKLLLCRNSSSMTKPCKPKEEIERILDNSIFIYGISSNSFDVRNYSNPYFPIIYTSFAGVSTDHLQTSQFFLKKIKLITDDGMLLQTEKSISLYQAKDPLVNSKSRTDDVFFEIFINSDKNEEVFYRNYDKIQDVLARTNSIIRLVLLVLYVLFKSFMNKKYHLSCYQNFDKLLSQGPNTKSLGKATIENEPRGGNSSAVNKKKKFHRFTEYLFNSKTADSKIELSKKCHDLAEIIQKSYLQLLFAKFNKEPPEKSYAINSAKIELNKFMAIETLEKPVEEEEISNKKIQSMQKSKNPAIDYLKES